MVESRVITNDYNHREAQNILMSVPADMTRGEGYDTSYGEVYHYRPRHTERGDKIDPAPETANFWARLDHERFLAEQTRITGKSTDASLLPAQVLTITDSTPPVLPAPLQEPVLLTQLLFTGSRKSALQVMLSAVPYSEIVCWRPPLLTRPKITGTMTARVTSAKEGDIYAWQDASGMYRVKFDADRDDKNPGQESMPVRLAKPYSGDAYGFHFPLIQGTEVAIAFEEGEPLSVLLRPYRQLLLAGIVFSPATVGGERSVRHRWRMDNRWEALPETVQQLPVRLQPSRTGHNWRRSLAVMAAILMMAQGTGMVVSFLANRSLVAEVQEQIRPAQNQQLSPAERLQALLNLQKSLARLQYREEHGAPWYLRAGMNQNADLLAVVMPL